MKKHTLKFAALLAAIALGAAPTAAHAVSWDGNNVTTGDETNGSNWEIDSAGNIDHSYVYVNGREFDRVICGTEGGLMLNGNDFNDSSGPLEYTVDSYGDRVITGAGDFSGTDLTATVEYRLYSAGDVLRTSYVLTNPTSAAITVTPSVYEDPSDNSSDAAFSTNGDNVADVNDSWYSTFDASYEPADVESTPSAVYTKFWGKKPVTLNGFSFAASDSSEDVEFAPITIAPGASYNWIFFHSYRAYSLSASLDADTRLAADNASAIAAGRAAVAEFRSNGNSLPTSGRLVRGLDRTLASNWGPAQDGPTEPTLANTGSSDLVLSFTGLGLIALGATAVAFNRRKENA